VVLLVAGESLARAALATAFESAGLEVIQTDQADAAFDNLRRFTKISAVVTDLSLSGPRDGLDLAKWMRENAAETPVILVSKVPVHADLRSINPAIAIVVRKPCPPQEIAEWVRSLVEVN